MFLFDEFQNSLGCTNSYTVSGIATSTSIDTVPDPNKVSFLGVDNIVATYSFQISVSSELSTYSTSCVLTTFCSAASISASSFATSQNADVASGQEYFELPPYTSVVIGCQTFTYELFDDTSASSSPSGLSVDLVNSAPNIRISADDGQLVTSYSFYIRVTEGGGAILWTSLCTLTTVCGPTSNPTIT